MGIFGRVEDDGYVCRGLGEGLGDCVSDTYESVPAKRSEGGEVLDY